MAPTCEKNVINISPIYIVIDHSEKINIEGAILFLDFTKAFYSLEWSFMTEIVVTVRL
jgi:hypothetical protein